MQINQTDTIQYQSPTKNFGNLLNKSLSNIKMLHWYTTNYNVHIILGELYDSLSDSFDKLQEEIIGTSDTCDVTFPLFSVDITDEGINSAIGDGEYENILVVYAEIQKMLKGILCSDEFKQYVDNVTSGLNNTKEEIISALNKASYLLLMIKI
jgi:DNA-binding ferritin-like protein